MKQIILAAAIIFASSIAADAQPVIRGKAVRQEQRIRQGQRNGQLTRMETARLQRKQALLRRDIRMAKADGRVTARERAIIRQRQAIASRSIYNQRHDFQYRR